MLKVIVYKIIIILLLLIFDNFRKLNLKNKDTIIFITKIRLDIVVNESLILDNY